MIPYRYDIWRQVLHITLRVPSKTKYNQNYKAEQDEVGGTCGTNGEKRIVYRLLVGKPEGKRSLGRPRRRWIYDIKMDLLEIGLSVVDWISLAQDRYRWRALVISVMNLRVMLGNYRVAAQLVASRVVLSSTEKLVSAQQENGFVITVAASVLS
jgi:hypothetical protein